MGWDYEPGDFQFAFTIDGFPVAGKFDQPVRAAVRSVHEQTGQELDDHGWDVIGVVEGPGKLQERVTADVTEKGSGTKVGTLESKRTIDCAVVRVIALHARRWRWAPTVP